MAFGKRFISTFSLVSRIPFTAIRDVDFSLTGFYFPLIGIVISILNVAVYSLFAAFVPEALLTVITIIVIQYLLFNLFHFDGFLDTVDALAVHAEKEKRLAILKDVSVGSFGLFFGALYICLKLYLLYRGTVHLHILSLPPSVKLSVVVLFFAYPVSGRIASSLVPCVLKPAKPDGLGALLKNYKTVLAVIGSLLAAALLCVPCLYFFKSGDAGQYGLFILPFLGGVIGYLVTFFLYKRAIGGYTGDTLGFAVEAGEVFHLLIFYLLLLYGIR